LKNAARGRKPIFCGKKMTQMKGFSPRTSDLPSFFQGILCRKKRHIGLMSLNNKQLSDHQNCLLINCLKSLIQKNKGIADVKSIFS